MAGLGSLLQIKPILTMHKGTPGAERVRTKERAIKRLLELADEIGELEELALVHTSTPDEADALWQRVNHLIPDLKSPLSVDVTPVLGAHLGPGAVGLTLIAQK